MVTKLTVQGLQTLNAEDVKTAQKEHPMNRPTKSKSITYTLVTASVPSPVLCALRGLSALCDTALHGRAHRDPTASCAVTALLASWARWGA